MTISDGFKTLLARIAPLQSEFDAAESHLATIRTRLSDAYTLKAFVPAGSYSRGTFIRGTSDVDVFAVVARDDFRRGGYYVSSDTALENFRRELGARFHASSVKRDSQAIAVRCRNCWVDVVPSFFEGMSPDKFPIYRIPDGRGDWMPTSTGSHNAFIRRADKIAGGKLRGTAQLLKFWRECRESPVPLSSFHIEMVLADEEVCRGFGKSYADCVAQMLQSLSQRECRGLQDPLEIGRPIPAVKSLGQRESALASVRYALDHARRALEAARQEDRWEALEQWDIVFRRAFPKS